MSVTFPENPKLAGQMQSLWDATRSHEDAFLDALGKVRGGVRMSLNTIRADLDAAGVPHKMRAGFMRQACAAGLLEPFTVLVDGKDIHIGVPSTGKSAKGADVKLYTRTSVKAAM